MKDLKGGSKIISKMPLPIFGSNEGGALASNVADKSIYQNNSKEVSNINSFKNRDNSYE